MDGCLAEELAAAVLLLRRGAEVSGPWGEERIGVASANVHPIEDDEDARCRVRTSDILCVRQALYR